MSAQAEYEDRKVLIHMLNSGGKASAAAQQIGRSIAWVYKWKRRYEQESWEGLRSRSRAPRRVSRKTPAEIRQRILDIRSELEQEAENCDHLGYIGADAIYGRLRMEGVSPLPAVSTIERMLRQAGRTRPRLPQAEKAVIYPQLKPTIAHQLTQVDIVPQYLTGGKRMDCFNGIDVVSRYPAGKQFASKRSADALAFVLHTWRELGLSEYLQMDNESCFNGGYKHPGVIGKVVRLALYVGVQPLFSPFYSPESNAFVERIHQDYLDFVWKKVQLQDLAAVHQRSALFFPNYRNSHHHSALAGKSPLEIHQAVPLRKLPLDFSIPHPLPITAGQVHFMRAVDAEHSVRILNIDWSAGLGVPDQGVWATLLLKPPDRATLRIYDAAPDAAKRRCLAQHPFPLKQPVVPLQAQFSSKQNGRCWWQSLLISFFRRSALTPSTMS